MTTADQTGRVHRVMFIRSMPFEKDPRSERMANEYGRHGFHVTKLAWTRGYPVPANDDLVAFRRAGRYGAKFGSLLNYVLWHFFIAWTMVRRRRSTDLVHVVDFNTAIIAIPLGRLLGKRLVYDACDHFAQVFPEKSWRWKLAAGWERWLIRRADVAIFPDPIRLEQYGLEGLGHACTIGNVPEDDSLCVPEVGQAPARADPLLFVYLGTLEAMHRGLEYIPYLCADYPDRVSFIVGGLGALDDFFTAQAARLDNLNYVGGQPYASALKFMSRADCLYGPYLLSAPAHIYAAPNKMYEHLLLGKPLITSQGTPVADFVEANGTGFIFDGDYETLRELVGHLDHATCAARGAHARHLWTSRYNRLRAEQVATFFAALGRALRPVDAPREAVQ